MNRRTGMILAVLLILSLAVGTAVIAAPNAHSITGPMISGGGGMIGTYARSVDSAIAQPVLAQGEANGVQLQAGLGNVISTQNAGGALRFRVNLPHIFQNATTVAE